MCGCKVIINCKTHLIFWVIVISRIPIGIKAIAVAFFVLVWFSLAFFPPQMLSEFIQPVDKPVFHYYYKASCQHEGIDFLQVPVSCFFLSNKIQT